MARKKSRELAWAHTPVTRLNNDIRVRLTDKEEMDRPTYLSLTVEQAQWFAGMLTQYLDGVRLVVD